MMRASTTAAMAVIASCVLLAACSHPVEPPPGARPDAAKPTPLAEITLREADAKQFAATLAKYRGKVVLVDYWATWCDPCKKLLPHTVALYRELAGQGLEVITVSFDDAEEEPAARKFLADQGANFENLRAQTGASSRSAAVFDIDGTLPFMRLYDRSGKIHKQFFAPIKPEEVERAVKELLAVATS